LLTETLSTTAPPTPKEGSSAPGDVDWADAVPVEAASRAAVRADALMRLKVLLSPL